jgi:hypothetical protein
MKAASSKAGLMVGVWGDAVPRASRAPEHPADAPTPRVAQYDNQVGNRLHCAWSQFLAPVPWDLWVTLTFASEPPSPEAAIRPANEYLVRLESQLRFRPPYLAVVEGGPDSATRTNVHVLIAGVAHVPKIRTLLRNCRGRRAWPDGHLRIDECHSRSVFYTTKDLPVGAPFLASPRFWTRVHNVKRFAKLHHKVAARSAEHSDDGEGR